MTDQQEVVYDLSIWCLERPYSPDFKCTT